MFPFDTLLDRLHQRTVCDLETGCWLWQGAIMKRNGYGQIHFSRRFGPLLVHRLAYAIDHGISLEMLNDRVVMHTCNTPACIRPSHLRLGTQRENLAYMREMGRALRGERSPNAKLTATAVRAIRAAWDEAVPASKLARQFNVSPNAVYQVVHNITWKHV